MRSTVLLAAAAGHLKANATDGRHSDPVDLKNWSDALARGSRLLGGALSEAAAARLEHGIGALSPVIELTSVPHSTAVPVPQYGSKYSTATILERAQIVHDYLELVLKEYGRAVTASNLPLALFQLTKLVPGLSLSDFAFIYKDPLSGLRNACDLLSTFLQEYGYDARRDEPLNCLMPHKSQPSMSAHVLANCIAISLRALWNPPGTKGMLDKVAGVGSDRGSVEAQTFDCTRFLHFGDFVLEAYERLQGLGFVAGFALFDAGSGTTATWDPVTSVHVFTKPGMDHLARRLDAYGFERPKRGTFSCALDIGRPPYEKFIRIYAETGPFDPGEPRKVADIRIPLTPETYGILMELLEQHFPEHFLIEPGDSGE